MSALWNLATFLHRTDGDAAGAERCYQQMLTRNRGDEDALAGYTELLAEQGRAEQAERLLEGVLEWDPRHTGALCGAAALARARNDTARAERLLSAAVRAAPADAESLCALGWLLEEERGDWQAAEKLYARAVSARPTHAVAAYSYAALLAERRSDIARADEMYQRAVEGVPHIPEILFAYGVFLEERANEPVGAEVQTAVRALTYLCLRTSMFAYYALRCRITARMRKPSYGCQSFATRVHMLIVGQVVGRCEWGAAHFMYLCDEPAAEGPEVRSRRSCIEGFWRQSRRTLVLCAILDALSCVGATTLSPLKSSTAAPSLPHLRILLFSAIWALPCTNELCSRHRGRGRARRRVWVLKLLSID